MSTLRELATKLSALESEVDLADADSVSAFLDARQSFVDYVLEVQALSAEELDEIRVVLGRGQSIVDVVQRSRDLAGEALQALGDSKRGVIEYVRQLRR